MVSRYYFDFIDSPNNSVLFWVLDTILFPSTHLPISFYALPNKTITFLSFVSWKDLNIFEISKKNEGFSNFPAPSDGRRVRRSVLHIEFSWCRL